MNVTPLAWGLTVATVVILLGTDWLAHGRRPHQVTLSEATLWSLIYIAVAMMFGVGLGLVAGWGIGAQYFAGYVVEKSLSIDNLFVFVLVIGSFSVPAEYQPKVVTLGIAVALALRGLFIALGAALLDVFSVTLLVFGSSLVLTGVQLYRHRDQDPSIDNAVIRAARRVLPVSRRYDGDRITTRENGQRKFTPLVLAMIAIGSSDLLFAFDSIPAVFGITDHAYIVFAANAFALLGLRALYFLVANMLSRLVYLSTGLALILAFIGSKLVLEFLHRQAPAIPEIPTVSSLIVIAVILAAAALTSLHETRRHPGLHAHAGALRGAPDATVEGKSPDTSSGGSPARRSGRHRLTPRRAASSGHRSGSADR